MALWNTIGDFLESSGWIEALSEAGIASSGTADSFLKAAHLTRTRHSHQVTLLALAKLQRDAWQTRATEKDADSFQRWRQEMVERAQHSSTGTPYWNIKYWCSSSSGLIVQETSVCTSNLWKLLHHGSFPWTMSIMRDGYQSTSEISKPCQQQQEKTSRDSGFCKRQTTGFHVCHWIKATSRTTKESRAWVALLV